MSNNKEQHEGMRIGEFLRTTSTVPGTDIMTWSGNGQVYYAQYRGQTDTVFVALDMNEPDAMWVQFATQSFMKDIYAFGANLQPD